MPNKLIASACLLTLLDSKNYLAVQLLHDSGLFSNLISGSPQNVRPALVDINFEVGPIVTCLCPSQLFWLSAMVTQVTKLFEAYQIVKNATKPDNDVGNTLCGRSVIKVNKAF